MRGPRARSRGEGDLGSNVRTVVEAMGIEPTTYGLQSRRSAN